MRVQSLKANFEHLHVLAEPQAVEWVPAVALEQAAGTARGAVLSAVLRLLVVGLALVLGGCQSFFLSPYLCHLVSIISMSLML